MLWEAITICFGACYAIALVLEGARLWLGRGVRPALPIGIAGVGWLLHSAVIVQRAVSADALPLSSAFDWFLLAAWTLAGVYLYLAASYPHAAIGVFVLPLVLALCGAAQHAPREPFAKEPAAQAWGLIHGVFLLLGTVSVFIGFAAGLMYLLQSSRLKHKLPPIEGFRFPSLEWLERVNSRALFASVALVGIGFVSGVILNLVNHQRQLDELPWTDPVVWRSAALLGWLVAAAIFNVVYKPARQGRKVAYLTVVSFVFLALSLAVRLTVSTEHGKPTDRTLSGAAAGPPAHAEARP